MFETIKKTLATTVVFFCIIQSISVYAEKINVDELYENLDAKLEEMWSKEGYDAMDDKKLLEKHEELGNKYAFKSADDIERQMQIYEQYTDNRLSGITGSKKPDGTYKTNIGFYSDRFASLAGPSVIADGTVMVNGEKEFKCIIFNDRTLVSLDVFVAAGCSVVYDEETMVTTVSKNDTICELMPYMNCMRKNGEEGYWVPLHICVRYIGDTKETYIPLRAVAEKLGIAVDWNEELHMALLN